MKQEVRRGRKFVEYHDPETQDEFTFTQEISGADVSYQDESGSWHPADENWATDGVDGFVLKNDKLNHKIRLKGNGGRTWYPRRNVNTEYMTFGVPQYWNGKRWANFGFSGWSVEGKTITLNTRQGVTILVHNRWNGIKIDWVLASSAAPSRMRYPVSLTGITYVDGIIYGADGTRLGQLTPTTATDSTFDEDGMPTQLPCSGSYSGGYVEFQADVTGASFPVTIDPDFSVQPDPTAGKDAMIYNGAPNNNYGGHANIFAGKGAALFRGLLQFDVSSIASGVTITVGTVSLYCSGGGNVAARDVKFHRLLVDWTEGTGNGAAGECNWKQRMTSTNWGEDGGLAGTDYATDATATTSVSTYNDWYTWNILADVQAWVGGTATNYGNFLIGNESDYYKAFVSSDYTTDTTLRPKLLVTYTAAATGTLRRTNMNAQMSNLTGGMHG